MTDMHPDEFRLAGHAAIDWIASHLDGLRDLPVLPRTQPGDLIRALPQQAPDAGEPFEQIFADFERQIVPRTTLWNHPRFHAYFSVSASGAGILADALAAALNVNHMLWKSSPAATELEQVTLNWLRQWLDLPEDNFGVIYDSASTSTMHALAAAREFVDPSARTEGGSRNLTVYASEQAHSSVEKGAIAIGIGQSNVRKVPADAEFRMIPAELASAIAGDRAAGKTPCCIVATVGTTSTTSIDPVREIAAIAAECGAWLHVDAAYGGSAAIVPEFKHVLDGVEMAQSLVVNPHKWLFTPIDLSVLYTRRSDILRRAFSLIPEYLRTDQDADVVNYMDYGVPLGRRFRSLKLWFVMRYFGRDGIVAILRHHMRLAKRFASYVESDSRFELCAPVPLSLVCFRLRASDTRNRKLMDDINASGVAFLSHTALHGKIALRLAIGNLRETEDDIDLIWRTIASLAD